MACGDVVIVGEHFRWHADTAEIEDVRTGIRRPDSDYGAKVDVFEDRVNGWFLHPAAQFTGEQSPTDYIALSVALAYLEGVEQYRRGQGTPERLSGQWFKEGIGRIFPSAPPGAAEQLWKAVRCGLFHSGFTSGPTLVTYAIAEPVRTSGRYLLINPQQFIGALVDDFRAYVVLLRAEPTEALGRNFESLWDLRWSET
jgi:hypothetical protein